MNLPDGRAIATKIQFSVETTALPATDMAAAHILIVFEKIVTANLRSIRHVSVNYCWAQQKYRYSRCYRTGLQKSILGLFVTGVARYLLQQRQCCRRCFHVYRDNCHLSAIPR